MNVTRGSMDEEERYHKYGYQADVSYDMRGFEQVRGGECCLRVNVFSLSYGKDTNLIWKVSYTVDNTIGSYAETVGLLTSLQFLGSWRERILAEEEDLFL